MYSIDCRVKTNNDGIRNAVQAVLPSIDDPTVNVYDYVNTDTVDDDEVKMLIARIRFDVKSNRDNVLNSIKGISGIINGCESGSYVRGHICNGDDAPCEKEPFTEVRKP